MRARTVRSVRAFRTLTLSPRTEALLTSYANVTGISRGRIVDLAIEAVHPCDKCHGSGAIDSTLGPFTVRCPECSGQRLVAEP